MKNTVFAFLSLSTAVSTMGYAADHSLPQESVSAAAHTPEAASLRIDDDSNRPVSPVTASTVPQPRASDLILTVSNAYLTTPGESIPCAESTASPTPENLEEWRLNLQQLAHGDDINAMYEYADMLYLGQGGEPDLAEARRYFQQAADLDDARAMYCYARMLRYGQGGEQDLAKAKSYFQQAANSGHKKAMLYIAFMLRHGQGGE